MASRASSEESLDLAMFSCNASLLNTQTTQQQRPQAPRTMSVISMPAVTTAAAATSCWGRMGCLVDEDERADNVKLVQATKQKNYKECKKILEEGKTNVDTREETTRRTALHYAACSKKSEILKLLLEHNASCNVQDNLGNTPLHLAIDKNILHCCEILLKVNNLEVNLANKEKDTPLHLAAKKGLKNIIDKLLNLNADCRVSNASGNTPLHLAGAGGLQNVVEKLLEKQAYCEAKNGSGDTPLHLAAAAGHRDCCETLLEHRGTTIDKVNDEGNTPLHLAAKEGKSEVVELLRRNNADCNAKNNSEETPLHLVIIEDHLDCFQKITEFTNLDVNSKKKDGLTPLHCAAKKGNAEIIKQLLSHNANCNKTNNWGETPLHLAITKGHLSCCEELLRCDSLEVNEKSKNNEAPLHLAAKMGQRDVCDLILTHKKEETDIDILQDRSRKTPLHLAAQNSNDKVVELLLEKGAKWKHRDKQSYMALHYAAENGCEESCQYLVNVLNEDPNRKTLKLTLNDKKTPLMLAAKNGHYKCCERLLFEDIDAKDKFGNTALMYAIESGFLKTVTTLLEKGASTQLFNCRKRTVLHQAAKAKADECLKHLLKYSDTEELVSAKEGKYGFTPLHEAISNEALTCAKVLLDHGASTLEKCKEGMTPLHLAAKQGDPGLCSLLSSDKEKVNVENKDNQTPLHVAAMHGCRDACKVLLKTKGMKVLAKDKNGQTALHLAADKGHHQVLKLIIKKVSPAEKDDDGSTALHLAARNNHLECCTSLLEASRRLIRVVDGNDKLALDIAFEQKHDEVFAFLMRNFRRNKMDNTNRNEKNDERASRFHKYMHQALQGAEPRPAAAEAIIDSEWWEAGFFPQHTENSGENDKHYCSNFRELIKHHPSLALKAQNCCIQNTSDDKISHDFRLFDKIYCPEKGPMKPEGSPTLTSSQRLLQEHPLSLMVQHTRAELLQHSLIEGLLIHLWKTYLSYLFIFLLIIEVLYLASLVSFMANTDNWAHMESKCNLTYELLCGAGAHLSPKTLEGASNTTGAAETSRMESFNPCQNIVSSNFGTWFFLLVMTAIIMVKEGNYIYKLRTWYFRSKRLLRVCQICCTLILLPPIGICGFHHQTWIWTTGQWHFGIVGLLLEWLLVISMLNQLPMLFVFMPITRDFFSTYIKALSYILLILFAFSHIFHLLLADQAAFQSWPQSTMKMIVWLFGDYSYDDTFVQNNQVHPHMGRLMFVAFIIVVGGYIVNLAVTQPSERNQEFQRRAAYFRMESQSTLFLEMRACFPFCKLSTKCLGSKKNCLNALGSQLAKTIMRMEITHTKSKQEENSLQNLEQQVTELMNLSTAQAEELRDLKDKLDILFRRLPELRS